VLHGVDLEVPDGALAAVLGTSGGGKTTLLRCIAGFHPVAEGRIRVGDRTVAGDGVDEPPERRRVGLVPQDGALFSHLTVAGNVGFGLDRAGRRGGRVAEMLEPGRAGRPRRPPSGELSGGSSSAWRSPARSPPRPRSCCSTSPSPRSTRACAARSGNRCARRCGPPGPRPCS
jgi:iron(III) transport system ATP-binding protein